MKSIQEREIEQQHGNSGEQLLKLERNKKMRPKRTQQLIAAVLAALLLASSAWATPECGPDKCSACGDEAETTVCATQVGGESVSPVTRKANLTIRLPGAGGWAPVLTYDGMHYNVQGGLGDLWEHSEGIWIEDCGEGEHEGLYLWANARRRHHFKKDQGGNWVPDSDEATPREFELPWSIETSVVTGSEFEVHYTTSRRKIKYVFHGFHQDIVPKGRLKSKTVGGQTITFGTYTNGRVASITDALGRTITYQYDTSGSRLRKIIEPSPADTTDPLDNKYGRLTHFTYHTLDAYKRLAKISVGMPNRAEPTFGATGDTAPQESHYYWRTTVFRYEVDNCDLVAVVYPDGYRRAEADLVDVETANLSVVEDYAAVFYEYQNRDVVKETSARAGCSSCGGGQAYEYPGSLSDLDPTEGDIFEGGIDRNQAAHEIWIKRPHDGDVVEMVQTNADGQLVARWTELGDVDGDNLQRLERRTYSGAGQLSKVYTYNVTNELDPGGDPDVHDITSTKIESHVKFHTYTDNLLTKVEISIDDETWITQVEYAYNDTDFPKLITSETRYADDDAQQDEERITDFTYDDQGRLIKTERPTVTENTDMVGGSYRPTQEQRYVSDTDSRIAWTKDPEGIVTTYEYADCDGSEGFDLTRIVHSAQPGGLHLETRHEYGVIAGTWRRVKTVVDPNGLNRQTVFNYLCPDWTDDENAAGAFGNVIEQTAPQGNVTRRKYDEADRITESRQYDHDGATLLSKTEYTYNRWGQAEEIRQFAQTSPETTYTAVHEYDSVGRLEYVWERIKNFTSGTRGDAIVDDQGLNYDGNYAILGNLTKNTYLGQTTLLEQVDQKAGTAIVTDEVSEIAFGDPPIPIVTYEYDFMGRRTAATQTIAIEETADHDVTTVYGYDFRGRLETITVPITKTSWNDAANLSAYTEHTYDNLNQRTEVERREDDANGTRLAGEETYYDEAGRVYERRNINPAAAMFYVRNGYYYNKAGRLRRQQLSTSINTDYAYDEAGRLVKTIDPEGNETVLCLNAAGEAVKTLMRHLLVPELPPDPAEWREELAAFTYDHNGRLVKTINWGTNVGCAEQVSDSVPSASTDKALVTRRVYDGLGRIIETTGGDGLLTTTEYSLLSRVTKVTEDAGDGGIARVTDYTYDTLDTDHYYDSIIARNGAATDQTTQYHHDASLDATLVSKIVYDDSEDVQFTYEPNGAVDTRTDQRDWEVDYTYNGLGLVKTEEVTTGGGSGTKNVRYTYDAIGRLTLVEDDNGQTDGGPDYDFSSVAFTYTWSGFFRSVADAQTLDTWNKTTKSTYSTLNNRIQLEELSPIWNVINYTHDNLGRVVTITPTGGTGAEYTYKGLYLEKRSLHDSGGTKMIELTFTDGSTLDGYDAFGRPVWMRQYLTDDSTDVAKFVHSYDHAGNRLIQEDLVNPSAMDELYAYDTLDRVTSFKRGNLDAEKDAITGTPARQQIWTLDSVGNWTDLASRNSGTYVRPYEDRIHNTVNEITNIDPEDIGGNDPAAYIPVYDDAGNLIDLPTTDDSPNHEFIYDYRNRLIEVKNQGGTQIARFYYDGLNRMVKKDLTSGTADDRMYLYDGWQLVIEFDWDGEWDPWRQYVWGTTYIDEPLFFVNDLDDDGIFFDSPGTGSQRYYYCHNANFNVVAVVKDDNDNTATVVERIKYDPYGEATIWSQTEDTGNPYLFQGRRWDDDVDLYYFRNRWYSPRLGRFLQRDPDNGYSLVSDNAGLASIQIQQPTGPQTMTGEQLYEFALSDPVSNGDPLGLWSCCLRWQLTT